MTSALYEVETNEGDDGTMHPAEQVWTPCADGAADYGFIDHQSLCVAGIDGGADDGLYPVGFLVLGHQRVGRHHRGRRRVHGPDPRLAQPAKPRPSRCSPASVTEYRIKRRPTSRPLN
ncbi:hypothetical protein [Streptomyces durhamensis]|uniref:hypothetical protein n=1 Tax=Streptomyces durhamensis TaxID=68194 RepID=UPI0012FEA98D|nr:hypothetical protein [Streptomyces durhamensis]